MYVKNRTELLSHGNRALRQAALEIVERTLQRVDPYRVTRDLVHLSGDVLSVGDLRYDVSGGRRVYVLGAGKASLPIARALEDVLGDRITDSLVIVKAGQESGTRIIHLREASHPLPDERGYEAAKEMVRLATQKVILQADETLVYRDLVEVMDMARLAGVESISLVTEIETIPE